MKIRAHASDDDIALAKQIESENDLATMTLEDPHPLVTFFSRKGIPFESFAKTAGYSPAYFEMVLRRWKAPGKNLIEKIEEMTGMSYGYVAKIKVKENKKAKKSKKRE